MDRSVNRLELRGYVGRDPRVREIGERKVINLSIATNEHFLDKEGKQCEITTWHRVEAWSGDKMPNFDNIKKGTLLALTGKIRNNKYVNADNEEVKYNDVLAVRMEIEKPM